MEALLYVSSATALPTRRSVDRILAAAHGNNPRLDLTGMLLWADRSFAQLLEGSAAALDRMYATLKADDRHENLRVLSRWAITERMFGEWSMGAEHLDRRQNWELLRRRDVHARDADTCIWLLGLMADIRHRSRRA
jgi:hypothetical protein